jgi:hypothetical protein
MWKTGGRYPDWIADDVQIMRDCARYHCLPSQLDGEDWHVIARHRAIEAAEQRYLEADRKAREARLTRGRR